MLEIVILAAGASTRLGKSKQLLKINDEPIVCIVATIAAKLKDNFKLNQPTVILGKDAQKIEKALEFSDVKTIYNEQWKDGMGSSIATAANNLRSNSTAILLMTCDQILITHEALITLIQHWHLNTEKIIASAYNNTLGIPVIFPARYFPELCLLGADKGAKGLLKKYKDDVMPFDFPSATQDLDTKDDEAKVRQILEGNKY